MIDIKKILNEVIILEALHADGLEGAKKLRGILEGDVKISPKALSRKVIAIKAVNDRNAKIKAKANKNNN